MTAYTLEHGLSMSKRSPRSKAPAAPTKALPVGELLRQRRIDSLGKSVRDVAKLLGVAPIHVSDIETGRRVPSEDLLIRIASIYKVPEATLRAGFERPDAVVAEVASESPTAAAKVPEFLRTARGLDSKQWDQLIAEAKRIQASEQGGKE